MSFHVLNTLDVLGKPQLGQFATDPALNTQTQLVGALGAAGPVAGAIAGYFVGKKNGTPWGGFAVGLFGSMVITPVLVGVLFPDVIRGLQSGRITLPVAPALPGQGVKPPLMQMY